MDENFTEQIVNPKPWYRQELTVFIVGSVLIAFVLVVISMALYASSGAAQLDLSRPGYTAVRGELEQTDSFEGFSSSGPVTRGTLDQFLTLYGQQSKPVTNEDAFSPNSLEDQALGIDDVSVN